MPTKPGDVYVVWEEAHFGVVLPGEDMPEPGHVPPGEVTIKRTLDGGRLVYLWSYYHSKAELRAPVRQNPCDDQDKALKAALRYLDKAHPGWKPVPKEA